MKSLFWFVLGIAAGFVLSHLVDKDPRGHEVLAEIDARISEFTDRIGDAYREQEARISGTSGAPAASASPHTPSAAGVAQTVDLDGQLVD